VCGGRQEGAGGGGGSGEQQTGVSERGSDTMLGLTSLGCCLIESKGVEKHMLASTTA
jgi:hypothetical protein